VTDIATLTHTVSSNSADVVVYIRLWREWLLLKSSARLVRELKRRLNEIGSENFVFHAVLVRMSSIHKAKNLV